MLPVSVLTHFGAKTSLELLTQQLFQIAIPLVRVTRCLSNLRHIIATPNDMDFTFRFRNCRIEPRSIYYSSFLQGNDDARKLWPLSYSYYFEIPTDTSEQLQKTMGWSIGEFVRDIPVHVLDNQSPV